MSSPRKHSRRGKRTAKSETEAADGQHDDPQIQHLTREHRNIKKRRHVTLYDVVAGRVGTNGFLTKAQLQSDNYIPLAPQEVLFQRRKAAANFLDDYDADQDLPISDHTLPESDLLKALHAYASDFYAKATLDGGRYDFRSLDETALLALGFLLEEAAAEVLGENGDMVLTEPRGLEAQAQEETEWVRYQVRGMVKPERTPEDSTSAEEAESEEEELPRKRRRRRRPGFQSGYGEDD